AEMIWEQLFLKNSPISESCRGVLTTLNMLGLDVRKRDLNSIRGWFDEWDTEDLVTHSLELANVSNVCMTNSPFDDDERAVWESGFKRDPRFSAGLRIDPLLISWSSTCTQLAAWGYKVSEDLTAHTIGEVRRFLADWTERMNPRFVMVSLAPDFEFPAQNECALIIEKAIVPHCREFGIPFALMPGVRRQVNPELRLAGDGVGNTNLGSIQNLCAMFPDTKFIATVLARENQHELCVLARKFRNLHIFGCWWFLNNPSLIEEMTRMRVELLGLSFTPQHSDARVLGHLLYKWQHSRQIISRVLVEKYGDLTATGWVPTREEIQRDVKKLFGGAFDEFCALQLR
ncbi:MAG TPA: glucuronate isomerase, partial [Candidatus Limnocylindria bacterium]|nr:glucuronate isomerase [Candidatus Limnocylindria bacterium]